jgi:hypothetical protein
MFGADEESNNGTSGEGGSSAARAFGGGNATKTVAQYYPTFSSATKKSRLLLPPTPSTTSVPISNSRCEARRCLAFVCAHVAPGDFRWGAREEWTTPTEAKRSLTSGQLAISGVGRAVAFRSRCDQG